ncbi:Keratin, type I cytoskeletal 18 [Saguinus oedipus]|uniref:Keratin, type I cytoskeletal 18 n=1 Tax=Saguinus oedipus TaxID=9490 RepID=A0ABQ9VU17_SAGOE|nr:Keratin, type I cytoskeletal 18 [Saguinus oedipus]
MGGIQNEETMQSLNDRLASYLDRVRSLETENWKLESKFQEHLEKKGPQVRDWGRYFKTIENLRAQILANTVDDARIVLQIDDACLAADDFSQDKLAQKNREELDKNWCQQTGEGTTVVTTQSTEVGAAEMTLTELRPVLEINLDPMRNTKISLGNSLREVEARYALQMEQLNGILLHLESELAQTRAEGRRQAQEYKARLNIKVKLEAEIATYRLLLEDGEDFSLGDALDSSNSMPTIRKTPTRRIVDGKVVSATNDTTVRGHWARRSRGPLGE